MEIENFDQMKLLNDTHWEKLFFTQFEFITTQCIIEITTQKK